MQLGHAWVIDAQRRTWTAPDDVTWLEHDHRPMRQTEADCAPHPATIVNSRRLDKATHIDDPWAMPRRLLDSSRLALLALGLSACRYGECSSRQNEAATGLANPSIAIAAIAIVGIIVALSVRHRVTTIVFGAIGIAVGATTGLTSSCAVVLARSGSSETRAGVAFAAAILCLALGIVALVRGISARRRPPSESSADDDPDTY